jgi:hypothetical protein
MSFSVYHCTDWNSLPLGAPFGINEGNAASVDFPASYTKVADVETDDVNAVFGLTNHIDAAWQTNPGVTPTVPTARSTSVGDVAVDNEDGTTFVCASMGWTAIPTETV